MKIATVILTAGIGTRMKTEKNKVLHEVCGVPIIQLVSNLALSLQSDTSVFVVSEDNSEILQNMFTDSKNQFVVQEKKLGTGHAVICAMEKLKDFDGKVVILFGDTPLITKSTIDSMLLLESKISILAFENNDKKNHYGRVIRSDSSSYTNNTVNKIIEYKDATDDEKRGNLCNSGVFCVDSKTLSKLLEKVEPSAVSNEFYLTDIVKHGAEIGVETKYIECNENEVIGVNDCLDLAKCQNVMQGNLRTSMLKSGVIMEDSESVYLHYDTKIESGTVLQPNVYIGKNVVIKKNCVVKSFSHLEDCVISDNCEVGPFARIRGNATLEGSVTVGNFVEVKGSKLGTGTKAKHLSYIGDIDCGENVNIGAGTVFCNYDGFEKLHSSVGDNCSIGGNVSIISPISLGEGSIIAAGSTVTQDVPKNNIAINRTEQSNIQDGATRYRKKRIN